MTQTGSGSGRLKAAMLLLIASLIWGSAFVGQIIGMAGVGPLTFTAARFALGAAVVAPLAWYEWRRLRDRGTAPGIAAVPALVLLGLLLAGGAVLQQIGLVSTTATNGGFLTVLYVPLVPLLSWVLMREPPHWSVWPAAVGCVAGSWLLTGALTPRFSIGDAWVVASALPWALHVLLVGHIANRLRGAYIAACGQFVVCAAASGAVAFAIEPVSLEGLRTAAGAIAYTGVLSVGIAFTLQVVGQRRAHPADAAIVLSSETVFAAGFGAWLLGERIDSAGAIGCALILLGILGVQILPLLGRRRAAVC